jgi:ribosomal protein S18 acetylase RimI-like enzyme
MTFSVNRLHSRAEIYSFLKKDRLYAAYAIGDLEPALFEQCEWYASSRNGHLTALCLCFTGLPPDRLFLMGAVEDLAHILGNVTTPARAYISCRAQHLDVLKRFYSLSRIEVMLRMVLEPESFNPVDGRVERLGPGDVRLLRDLYRRYGDVAFAPYQLERGVFYGVKQDGRLVATAGTHLVSLTYRLGVVGNVFTHPQYRGMGHAAVCTSAVVEELLSLSLDVALNVGQRNEAASKLYRGLGFDIYCSFIEALGVRQGAQ